MKRRRVLFTTLASGQVQAARAWWIENGRQPETLADEIELAIVLLSWLPGAGSAYPRGPIPNLRRLYLRRVSAHIYYTFTQNDVTIHAFWHAKRGRGPTLSS